MRLRFGPSLTIAALLVLVASPAGATELKLTWRGAATDRDPGTWTVALSGAAEGAPASWDVDGAKPVPLEPGTVRVPTPNALGPHQIVVRGPNGLILRDRRVIVDDDPTPPSLTVAYAGKGTVLEPGVWMITLVDPHRPGASGSYRINEGASTPLGAGSTVVAVPYFPGRYTIAVTASNNDHDRPGDEDVTTVRDTREVR